MKSFVYIDGFHIKLPPWLRDRLHITWRHYHKKCAKNMQAWCCEDGSMEGEYAVYT